MFRLSAVLLLLACWSSGLSQQILYTEDFEKGPATPLDKIKRYAVSPEAVNGDATYPQAFPPPSGSYCARAADPSLQYYGLGSIVVGPTIDLSNPAQQYASIRVKVYVPPPNPETGVSNVSMIAVNDEEKIERYYRFGFAKGNVYFHYFDGNTFKEAVYDPDLAAEMRIPGWHSLTIRFNGVGEQYCYIDGKQTSFSPLKRTELTRVRAGALGWDKSLGRPVLADDVRISLFSEPAQSMIAKPGQKADPGGLVSPAGASPAPASPAQPVVWHTDVAQAVAAAGASARKFLVVFYQDGHPMTQQLAQQTTSRPEVQATLSRFVCVSLEARAHQDTAQRYGIYRYPTMLVLDMPGRVYWEYVGVISPVELNDALSRF